MKIDGLHISGGHRLLPPPGFLGITLFGRVWTRHSREELAAFLQTERGRVFVNHERIHLIQARTLRWWGVFYAVYFWYWLKLFLVSFHSPMAYLTNPFEMEAYANERDLNFRVSHWRNFRMTNRQRRRWYKEHGETSENVTKKPGVSRL
jgi:hypothetical protein